jgi:putative transcriptional regulator
MFRRIIIYNISKKWGISIMKRIHMRIEELLKERGISKNQICKDLDIPRGNFNRYCRDQFQRIDANLVVKLCGYLNCDIQDLLILQEGEH